jgi:hypothetical protein
MSKRNRKFKDRKRKRTRRHSAIISLRHLFSARLHRRPCLWDVLIHELAEVISNRCRHLRTDLLTDTFRFNDRESVTVGWILARGFEILVSQDWPVALDRRLHQKLCHLDESSAKAISECAAQRCFDPLLRKYVEDTRDMYPGRPHDDLAKLTTNLGQALQLFLVSRCSADGKLHECLVNPLGDDNGYFPNNGKPMDPDSSCAEPLGDIRRLALSIHDQDDGGDVKGKLVHFVRNDPWLFAEWMSFVQQQSAKPERRKRSQGRHHAVDEATDEFIFRATHLDGKTPIQLFLERQKDMSNRQAQRLRRWETETFYGMFLVQAVERPFVHASDLASEDRYRLTATKPGALASFGPGDLICSRITPWDDYWLFSGIQQCFRGAGKDRNLVSELKREAKYRPMVGHTDPDDPRIQEGFKIQQQQYQAWIDVFGQEEILFEDGLELAAAINRFDRYWTDEMIVPDSGLTRAQLYQQRHGHEPPGPTFSLPEALLEAKDTAAVFDRRHGLAFYWGYGLFRSAFEGQGQLTTEQARRIWEYLTNESIDYWLFQRMRDQFPERTQDVLRQTLRDDQFRVDHDFDAVLRKFKGEAMRRPVRPMVTVVDPEVDDVTTRE